MNHSVSAVSEESRALTRRGLLKLVVTAGLGLVAANVVPGIAWADGEGLSRDGVKARFFIGSDLHIQNQGKDDQSSDITGAEGRDADKKLLYAFDVAYALDPQLDAFCLVGDITDNGRVSQYKKVMSLINDARNKGYAQGTGHTKMILCQGNHETYTVGAGGTAANDRFKEQTGQDVNKVVDVNGVKVITMGPNNGGDGYYVANYDWFKQSLESEVGSSTAPFLVLTHHQIKGSTYTSPEWNGNFGQGGDSDIAKLMGEYPNLVQVSGHSHATMEDERSISQDLGFTAIQDATIGAYYENETGKVDPDSGNGASVPPQTSAPYTEGKDIPEASQAVILDFMENGQVKAYRIALNRSKAEGKVVYLYEPWVIDVPALVQAKGNLKDTATWQFTSARQSTAAPKFPAGAQVTVDGVDEASATVHFPTAEPGSASNLDMVHEYKLTATPKDGGDPVVHRVFNDYYRPLAYLRKTWDVKFKGLNEKTTYTMSVVAQTSWNKEEGSEGGGTWTGATQPAPNSTSAALVSAAFTTVAAPESPRAILDIDYRTGKPEDAMGHKTELFGASKIVEDDELKQKVLETDGQGGYRYTLTDADYNVYQGASTAELLVKLTDNLKDEQALFANEESAGAGFEVAGNKAGRFEYWYNDGSYKAPDTEAVANTWTHLLAVADGKTVTLYKDGKKVSSANAGKLKVPGPQCYFVGCDTNGSGQPQFISKAGTRIAFARLYPYAMTAEQAATAYAASKLAPAPEKLLDVDFNAFGSAAEVKDAAGRELSHPATDAKLVKDETLGRTVFAGDGQSAFGFKFEDDVYTYLGNEHALECLFMFGNTTKDQCLLSNQQGAGEGLEVAGDSGTVDKLAYWFHSRTDGNPEPAFKIDANTWHHVVGSYDGRALRMFLDGKLMAKVDARGGLNAPGDGAREYYVGGDTNGNNGPALQLQEGGKIAFARVWSKAPSAEQVAKLAEEALKAPGQDEETQQAAKDLKAEIDAIKADQSKYTAESWAAFAASLASYEELAADGNATKDELTKALADLKAKYAAAQSDGTLKPVEQGGDNGGNNGGNNGNQGGNNNGQGGNNNGGNQNQGGNGGQNQGGNQNNGGSNKKPAGTSTKKPSGALPQTGDPLSFAALGGTGLAGLGALLAGLRGRKAAATAAQQQATADDPAADDSDLDE